MDKRVLFSERQGFKQLWLWLIILGVNVFLLFGVVKQVVFGQQFGNKPMSNTGLLVVTGIMIVLTVLTLTFRLDTMIKKDGIYVRLFPFQIKYRHYSWSRLAKLYIRKYSPVFEFGGWGIRIGPNGKAFNISGNEGLQLEFSDGKKRILIGTNKSEEILEVLNKLGKIKQSRRQNRVH